MRLKKTLLYFFIFLVLANLNLLVTFLLVAKSRKDISTQTILNEIGNNYDPNKQFSSSSAPFVADSVQTDIQLVDGRVANLRAFFRRHNSVLYDNAEEIVKVSDKYKFDYRLLPAIAMQESNLCKYIPDDSHNSWGWGIYGSTVTKFDSFDEAIEAVGKGIKKDYIDKGLLTASTIMQKYTPSSNGSWANGVNTFLRILE